MRLSERHHSPGQMSSIFTPIPAGGIRFLLHWAGSVEVGLEKMYTPAPQDWYSNHPLALQNPS